MWEICVSGVSGAFCEPGETGVSGAFCEPGETGESGDFCESGVSGESSCLVSPDALGVTVF